MEDSDGVLSVLAPQKQHDETTGRFLPGNTAATRSARQSNGRKRADLARTVLENLSEEGIAAAIRVAVGFASDFRKPLLALKALDLLTRISGLQIACLEISTEGESDNPAVLRTRIMERLIELEQKPCPRFEYESSGG